jgi:hypothetical protein
MLVDLFIWLPEVSGKVIEPVQLNLVVHRTAICCAQSPCISVILHESSH